MTIWEKKYECRCKHINKYFYLTAKQQDKHKQTNEQVQYLQFNGIFQVILILILTLEWSIFCYLQMSELMMSVTWLASCYH